MRWKCETVKNWEKVVSQPYETLALRLTIEKIAAIRKCVARRKRQTKECSQIDLGEINETGDLQPDAAEVKQSK
jgi:hypothetical protein